METVAELIAKAKAIGLIPMAAYLRLSHEGEDSTIAQQNETCHRLAKENGGMIVAIFTENGESAFDRENPDDREAYGKLVVLVRSGDIGGVCAHHGSRLWRDDLERALYVRQALKGNCPLVLAGTNVFDLRNPEDNLMSGIFTLFDKHDSAVKSRRVRDQKEKRREQGRSVCAVVSFGWYGTRHGAERNDGTTIYEPEAQLIREAARRILAGETHTAIATDFNARGYSLPRTGTPFTQGSIRQLLVNPRNAGHMVHVPQAERKAIRASGARVTAEIYKRNAYPAILDEETSSKLVAHYARKARGRRAPNAGMWSGVFRCARCEATMVRGGTQATPDFVCQGCWNTARAKPLEVYAARAICAYADGDLLREMVAGEAGSEAALLAELAQARNDNAEWLAMLKAREVDRAEYAELKATTNERIAKLERALDGLGAADAFAAHVGDGRGLAEAFAAGMTASGHRAVYAATGCYVWVNPAGKRGGTFKAARIVGFGRTVTDLVYIDS